MNADSERRAHTDRTIKRAGVLFFGFAALAVIRLAVADTISRQDTPAAIGRAITLEWPVPSAELEQTLAEVDPGNAREALTRAAKANPRSSPVWIALGLSEEAGGGVCKPARPLKEAAQ